MVLAVLVGCAAAVLDVALAGRVMDGCDIGINAAANSFALTFALPVLAVANAVVVGFAVRLTHRAVAPRRGAAVVAALAAAAVLALVLWGVLALAVPADYPSEVCPGGALPWWPDWLPV